ncbi:ReoY family proteolytic degradation factor [Bacillus taeanensis]|uniref:UPF0302 protein DS031_06765 n=1 Tax=Bacillus taeanensis TaxID=273032 RepID=A0A366XZQ9_9BACI|nr:ReoY family proteolytic degradation factor [Bacillus taeanensis]RBW70269.1 hypothetical protein DS031_06765 [Bacillus taeanensis]
MGSTISVSEKKDFLKWFLKNYKFQKRECVWLLNYLLSDDVVMEKVHFVEKAEYCPKAMIISTMEMEEDVPFRFYKQNIITTDAEKSFHDIRLNQEEDIYIQLNFLAARKNPKYAAVVEENPFLPETLLVNHEFSDLAEQILDESFFKFKRNQLMKKIDQALDQKDINTFQALTEELKKILQENP